MTASPANRKAAAEAALQAWGKRASNGDGNGSGSKTQQPALQQQQAAHGGRRLDRLRLIPCGDHVDLALIEVHGPSGLYLRAASCPFEQSRKGSRAGLVTIHDFLSYFEPETETRQTLLPTVNRFLSPSLCPACLLGIHEHDRLCVCEVNDMPRRRQRGRGAAGCPDAGYASWVCSFAAMCCIRTVCTVHTAVVFCSVSMGHTMPCHLASCQVDIRACSAVRCPCH